ncbi:hypothetical protein N7519_010100 [Penicillium mononematosum]|uniref:uncharacterized protein n=1 Tax=Penicillium mononematosum TaxID=268346 RepID=UPI002547551B|nr:uncharacterized protein N7519_010100 [Penicillium mononematosum]KAJ6179639.1 hypothetical protein N7519_010100 [Penicillium mononematosum]
MSVPPIPLIQIAAVIASGTSDTVKVGIKSNRPVPTPGKGEILVKLEFSGVCHSDLHSIRGDTPMLTDVAGHEGVGKVVKVGPEVDEKQWMGTRVGIRWLYSSCRQCEICEINHTVCPYQKNAGANVPGTFQQYIVSPALHVTRIPEQLSPDSAAPLLCAGIAMYSSIMKTKTRPGDYLAILGAGGESKLQLKRASGSLRLTAEIRKSSCAFRLGLLNSWHYRELNIVQAVKAKTTFGVHAVICTANGERAYEQSMQMLRPFGTLVCVGIPNKPFRLPATPFDMIVKGLTIVGNSAGTADEMDEMLAMAVAGDVKAHVEVFGLDDINDVLDRLERSEIDGRVVLRIPQ